MPELREVGMLCSTIGIYRDLRRSSKEGLLRRGRGVGLLGEGLNSGMLGLETKAGSLAIGTEMDPGEGCDNKEGL